jgi:hypothetical protein
MIGKKPVDRPANKKTPAKPGPFDIGGTPKYQRE